MWEATILGFQTVLEPFHLLMLISGTFLGIFVGAVPGMNGPMAIVLLAPFTLTMPFTAGLTMAVGIYCGQLFGGSITAILFKAPGTEVAAATVIDGYEATKKGNSEIALRTAILSSAIGGLFSLVVLMVFAPRLARFALTFSSIEYFAFAFFGLCVIGSLLSDVPIKGMVMMFIGLFLTTVGTDPMTGVTRFTFGYQPLLLGFEMIPVLLGLYPMAETFVQIVNPKRVELITKDKKGINWRKTINSIWGLKNTILRSSILGTLIGMLPGAGGTAASFMAYADARRSSKQKSEFGKGCLEGIAAPEAANNASSGGAMIPLLTLGIPGSLTTAVIIGLFISHGLQPGPLLFINQPIIAYSVYAGLFLANLLLIPGGIYGAKLFSKFSKISPRLLYPIIFCISITGAYSMRNSFIDVYIAIFFAIVGFYLQKYDYPAPPLVIGMVLGSLAETTFRESMLIFNKDLTAFFTRPISAIFMSAAFLSLIWPVIKNIKEKYGNTKRV